MPCTTILVGKKATYDGSTMIARTEDYLFQPKKAVVVLPARQPRKYKTVTSHLELTLPDNPMRYTSTPNVLPDIGVWAAHGINEANVAMTATETITSNPLVMGADPLVVYKKAEKRGQKDIPGGIGEEDIVLTVLPYVHTAREGVLRLGSLLEQYGTYERNGIAFQDTEEIWWLETIGGHHWIAKRVPDDRVVLMPNQLGIDEFDLDDALGEGKNHLWSRDMREFISAHNMDVTRGGTMNPRWILGSHSHNDHIYNTSRAWFMGRYLCPTEYDWDGENADFTPESDDIPWSLVPERRVTVEDIHTLLSSHYEGTPYDPYEPTAAKPGYYRPISVNTTNVLAIMQLRPDVPAAVAGLQWLSFGPSAFNALVPVYTAVSKLPKYLSDVTGTCTTENLYWASRLMAALTDPVYKETENVIAAYRSAVAGRSHEIVWEYDRKIADTGDVSLAETANDALCAMMREETDKAMGSVLLESTKHMKLHRA